MEQYKLLKLLALIIGFVYCPCLIPFLVGFRSLEKTDLVEG